MIPLRSEGGGMATWLTVEGIERPDKTIHSIWIEPCRATDAFSPLIREQDR